MKIKDEIISKLIGNLLDIQSERECITVALRQLKRMDCKIHPLSGSVSYRNQWAVTHCDRVGKNAIKLKSKNFTRVIGIQ